MTKAAAARGILVWLDWVPPPHGYVFVGAYSSPQFPLNRKGLPKGKICVDELWKNGVLIAVKIHDDTDDPEHVFLDQGEWFLWPNKRRLAEMHGLPFRRSMRLAALRENRPNDGLNKCRSNYFLAEACLRLQKRIISDPESEAVEDGGWGPYENQLSWSPSGQVFLNGERWVHVMPPTSALPKHSS